MTEKRFPQAGDAVRLTGVWNWASELKVGEIGIINGSVGIPQEFLSVIWRYSAFRGYSSHGAAHYVPERLSDYFRQMRAESLEFVSVSGGPGTIALPARLLKPTDELLVVNFWCWLDLPRANGGAYYTQAVPVWKWDGKGYE